MAFVFEELKVYRKALYETVTRLQIFQRLNWLKGDHYNELYNDAKEINKMLSGLINSL